MRKTPLFASFLALAFLASGGHSAQNVQAAEGCDLTPQAAALVAAQQDASMSESGQLAVEITARRRLQAAAITCDKNEISTRLAVFSELPNEIKITPTYKGILEELAEVSAHYERQEVAIWTLSIWDLKVSARSMAAWRKDTYLPTITWADNFLMWADNQQFLDRASDRLTQASRVAFSLKLANQDEVDDLFNKAEEYFKTAVEENDRAKNALEQKRSTAGLAHIQASLDALADTYDAFFTLHEALRKVIK